MNIHIDVENHGNNNINNNVNINVNNIFLPPQEANPAPNNHENEGADALEQIRLDAYPRGKQILVAAAMCVIATILCVLLAAILPWFQLAGGTTKYYSQDQFLWLFLLPSLSAVPLMFSSIAMRRICWLHCWTVTVISIDVPSAVIFVSFGASLVYSGVGIVQWTAGAYLIVLAHLASILGGLLFMKLAQVIEMGPPEEEERPPVGPISVTIGVEDVEDATQEERQSVSEVLDKTPKYGGVSSPGPSSS